MRLRLAYRCAAHVTILRNCQREHDRDHLHQQSDGVMARWTNAIPCIPHSVARGRVTDTQVFSCGAFAAGRRGVGVLVHCKKARIARGDPDVPASF